MNAALCAAHFACRCLCTLYSTALVAASSPSADMILWFYLIAASSVYPTDSAVDAAEGSGEGAGSDATQVGLGPLALEDGMAPHRERHSSLSHPTTVPEQRWVGLEGYKGSIRALVRAHRVRAAVAAGKRFGGHEGGGTTLIRIIHTAAGRSPVRAAFNL